MTYELINAYDLQEFIGNNDPDSWKRHCIHRSTGNPITARYWQFCPVANSANEEVCYKLMCTNGLREWQLYEGLVQPFKKAPYVANNQENYIYLALQQTLSLMGISAFNFC